MDELWAPAYGFEGLYECSTKGRVRRIKAARGTRPLKLLKPNKLPSGYMQLSLRRDNAYVNVYVHRLIAASYLGRSVLHVNHINGKKNDNRLSNLEYVTVKENKLHAVRVLGLQRGENHWNARLTEKDALEIHRLRSSGLLQREIAARFGIKRSTVAGILSGRQWRYLIA